MFVVLVYVKLNGVWKEKYFVVKVFGYEFVSYVSFYVIVLNDGWIGENVFLFEDNIIQLFVLIGNNVILWSGNYIGYYLMIYDYCFLVFYIVVFGGVVIEE